MSVYTGQTHTHTHRVRSEIREKWKQAAVSSADILLLLHHQTFLHALILSQKQFHLLTNSPDNISVYIHLICPFPTKRLRCHWNTKWFFTYSLTKKIYKPELEINNSQKCCSQQTQLRFPVFHSERRHERSLKAMFALTKDYFNVLIWSFLQLLVFFYLIYLTGRGADDGSLVEISVAAGVYSLLTENVFSS